MVIYEAIWSETNKQGEVETKSFLAETRYLAKHYCGAPQGAVVHIRQRRVMFNV